jgi:hypothetical protein
MRPHRQDPLGGRTQALPHLLQHSQAPSAVHGLLHGQVACRALQHGRQLGQGLRAGAAAKQVRGERTTRRVQLLRRQFDCTQLVAGLARRCAAHCMLNHTPCCVPMPAQAMTATAAHVHMQVHTRASRPPRCTRHGRPFKAPAVGAAPLLSPPLSRYTGCPPTPPPRRCCRSAPAGPAWSSGWRRPTGRPPHPAGRCQRPPWRTGPWPRRPAQQRRPCAQHQASKPLRGDRKPSGCAWTG